MAQNAAQVAIDGVMTTPLSPVLARLSGLSLKRESDSGNHTVYPIYIYKR